jgi:hypothetical protein
MRLHKVRITLNFKDATLEVDALASTKEKPALAVHKGVTKDGKTKRGCWTVTHTQSGYSALTWIPNEKAARAALEFLEGLTDEWSKPPSEWKDARAVFEKIKAYKEEKGY